MKTVLLVDDEHAIVDALTGILEDEGYRVIAASNGKLALDRLEHERPDVVLLDVMMPVLGGREVLQAIRAHEAWRSIPVVLMSAVPLAVLRRDSKEPLQFEAFLPKPFDLELLLSTVAKLSGK